MRIRAGFVSNSSSTSFLIIAKDELTEASFLELMGVAPDSPIAGLFRELFRGVLTESKAVNLATVSPRVSPERWFDTNRMSPVMIERLRELAGQGVTAYYGSLSSDDTLVQSFFCTDAFEIENERIYFNYLECAW
jgi:hypothetical protein